VNRNVLGGVVAGCVLIGAGVSKWNAAQNRSWLMNASIQALDKYVSDHPEYASGNVRLGQMYVANKDPRGIDLLKATADEFPENEAVWFAYVDAIEDPSEAMALLETYLKVLPDSVKLQAAKARRLAELGDPDASLKVTDDLLKRVGNDADVLRARADAFMLLRRVSEASDTLQAAIKLDDRAELRLLLAMTLVPQQRYKELRDVCSPMVASSTSGIAEGHKLRARVYLAGAALNLATPVDDIKKTATDLEDLLTKTAFLEPQEQFLPVYFLGES